VLANTASRLDSSTLMSWLVQGRVVLLRCIAHTFL
jgi:hypothetical protein